MVLHELCYNALVHALGAGGTLTVRARQTGNAKLDEPRPSANGGAPAGNGAPEGSFLVIDVVDDGVRCRPAAGDGATPEPSAGQAGAAAILAPAEGIAGDMRSGTGIGIGLVEGLVGRELRGTFS